MGGPGTKDSRISPMMNALIGGVTGAIEISITYPTEYTKTIMQLYPELNKKGAITNIRETMNQRGFLGLYRGYSSLLFFSVPKNYVRFGIFHYMKENVFSSGSKLANFTCGLTAGAVEAATVVTFAETLKVKLIHDKFSETPKYTNLFQGIFTIVKQEGLGGIYKGVVPTILKQSTNQGIRFMVFEDSSKFLRQHIPFSSLADLIAGGFAGAVSVMANNPIDVVKTNVQGLNAEKYSGFSDCFKQIYQTEGIGGFYKGVGPRLARVVLDVALTFAIFGAIKRGITNMMYPTENK